MPTPGCVSTRETLSRRAPRRRAPWHARQWLARTRSTPPTRHHTRRRRLRPAMRAAVANSDARHAAPHSYAPHGLLPPPRSGPHAGNFNPGSSEPSGTPPSACSSRRLAPASSESSCHYGPGAPRPLLHPAVRRRPNYNNRHGD